MKGSRTIFAAVALSMAVQSVFADFAVAAALPASLLNRPPVFIVQDIHLHSEAQIDIAATLRQLQKQLGTSHLRVGVEGAAGSLNFEPYRNFPDIKLIERIGRQLLNENRITGPVFDALCDKKISLTGIEAPILYTANVEAYRRARGDKAAVENYLRNQTHVVRLEKRRRFPANLREFDRHVEAFRAGRLGFAGYTRELQMRTQTSLPAIRQFLAAHALEQTLDFSQIDLEQQQLARDLAARMGSTGLPRELIPDGTRSRRIEFIMQLARSHGVDLSRYPNLIQYSVYLRLTENLNSEQVFSEARSAESEIYRRLCAGSNVLAALVEQDRQLNLSGKLTRFELTPQEWHDYRAGKQLPLAPFETFYRRADERSAAMLENALRANVQAVVVGGFHTPDLVAAFEKRGRHVQLIRPKITHVDLEHGSAYLSVFAAQKTPLQKIFSNWKLLLAPPIEMGVSVPLIETAPGRAALDRQFVDRYLEQTPAAEKNIARRFAVRLLAHKTAGLVSETALYNAPLVAGLAIHSPTLIMGGLALSWLIHPTLGHARVDASMAFAERLERIHERVRWSSLFTAALVVTYTSLSRFGVPPPVSALTAWLVTLAIHAANHWISAHPAAALSRRLVTMGLPAIRMSTTGDMSKARLAKVLAAWKVGPDTTNRQVMEDDVTRFFVEESVRLSHLDNDQRHEAYEGFAQALFEAGLSIEQFRTRIFRDQSPALQVRPDLEDFGGSNVQMIGGYVYNQLLRLNPPMDIRIAIVEESALAVVKSTHDMGLEALLEWKQKYRAAGGDMSVGQEKIDSFYRFVRIQLKILPDLQSNPLPKGWLQAYLDAQMTPEELRWRVAYDRGQTLIMFRDLTPDHGMLREGFAQLRDAYLKAGKPTAASNALELGSEERVYQTAYREIRTSVDEWRELRAHGQLVGVDQLTIHLSLFLEHSEGMTQAKMGLISKGFVDGLLASDLNEEEIGDRYLEDLRGAMAIYSTSDIEIGIPFVVGAYNEYAARSAHREDVENILARAKEKALVQLYSELPQTALDQWADSNDLSAEGLSIFAQFVAKFRHLNDRYFFNDYKILIFALNNTLSHSRITTEQFRFLIPTTLGVLMASSARDRAAADKNLTVALNVFNMRTIVTADEDAAIIRNVIDSTLNINQFFRDEIGEWKAQGLAEDSPVEPKLKNTWAAFLMLSRTIYDEDEIIAVGNSISQALISMNLPEQALQYRAYTDLSNVVQNWLLRDASPLSDISDPQIMDRDIVELINFYKSVADHYLESDPARSAAIMNGIWAALKAALLDPKFKRSTPAYSEDHVRSFLPVLSHAARVALHLKQSYTSLTILAFQSNFMLPGDQAYKLMEGLSRTGGEAFYLENKPSEAIDHGYEAMVSIDWSDFQNGAFEVKNWIRFVSEVYVLAQLEYRVGYYQNASMRLDFLTALFEQRPQILNLLPAGFPDKIEQSRKLVQSIVENDVAFNAALTSFASAHQAFITQIIEIAEKSAKADSMSEVEPLLLQLFSQENHDRRFMGTLARVARHHGADPKILLDAVDRIVQTPDRKKAPVSVKSKLSAIQFAEALAAPGFDARWVMWLDRRKSNKVVADILNTEVPIKAAMAESGKLVLPMGLRLHDLLVYNSEVIDSAIASNTPIALTFHNDLLMLGALAARLRMPVQSAAFMTLARKVSRVRKAVRSLEDLAVIEYPALAGDTIGAVRSGLEFLRKGNEAAMSFSAHAFMEAVRNLKSASWTNEREFRTLLESSLVMVARFAHPSFAASVEYTKFSIYSWLGQRENAHRALLNTYAEGTWDDNQTLEFERIFAALDYVHLQLRSPELPLNARIERGREILGQIRGPRFSLRLEADIFEFMLDLILLSVQPANDARALELCARATRIIEFADENKLFSRFLPTGFQLLAAQVLLMSPEAEESYELSLTLRMYQKWWGGRAEAVTDLSFAIREALANDPATLLDWSPKPEIAAEFEPYELALWKLTAAERAGLNDAVTQQLMIVLNQHRVPFGESHLMVGAADDIVQYPLIRQSFLRVARERLANFDAAFWADNKIALRRFLTLASWLGDAQILYALDKLALRKDFHARDLLIGDKGLIAAAEPSLSYREWLNRVAEMMSLDAPEAERIRQRIPAQLADATVDSDDHQKYQSELQERARIAVALKEARAAYSALEFQQALDLIHSVDRARDERKTADVVELERRAEGLADAWQQYQDGNDDLALALVHEFRGDVSASLMDIRIHHVKDAREALLRARPELAREHLGAINGPSNDPRKNDLSDEIEKTIDDTETLLEGLKKLTRDLKEPAGEAMNAYRNQVAAIFAKNAEHMSLMFHLIDAAKMHIKQQHYALADELLLILARQSIAFDSSDAAFEKFRAIRAAAETVRVLARAHDMKAWLEPQRDLLQVTIEAQEHMAQRLSPKNGSDDVRDQIFGFTTADFSLRENGLLQFSGVWTFTGNRQGLIPPHPPRALAKGQKNEWKLVDLLQSPWFGQGGTFICKVPIGNETLRVSMTLVRNDPAEGLLMLPDKNGYDRLKAAQAKGVAGQFVYSEDHVMQLRINGLNDAISYLQGIIDALESGRKPTGTSAFKNQLFGLDIGAQPMLAPQDLPDLSSRLLDEPSQSAAVLAALHPNSSLVEIQGPPGTGKTFTASEIERLLLLPHRGGKGRIVVLTAHAHAGLDSMGVVLKNAGVPYVRAGSENIKDKIARDLRANYDDRVSILMAAIERHHAFGEGFVYLATSSGLTGDSKCYQLLRLYLSGTPMNQIRVRYAVMIRKDGQTVDQLVGRRLIDKDNSDRSVVRPVWGLEEAGQSNAADTLIVPFALGADRVFLFGDQNQLSPVVMADKMESFVRREIEAGLVPSGGKSKNYFSADTIASMERSLFEVSFGYLEKWNAHPHFLDHARRSQWLIGKLVNVYYNGRLRIDKEPSKDPIRPDTVVFIDTQGQEQAGKSRGPGADGMEQSLSKKNFIEAGEVVRSVVMHLNSMLPTNRRPRKEHDQDQRLCEPKDILILTPYAGQEELLNEALRVVAILSDLLRSGAKISSEEEAFVSAALKQHGENPEKYGRIVTLFKKLSHNPGPDRKSDVAEILVYLYNLHLPKLARQITRSDLPPLEEQSSAVKSGPRKNSTPFSTQDQLASLDEQSLNVLVARTVHSVQGQERKVVILSMAASKPTRFLNERSGERIINVAISRAQEKLTIISSNRLRYARSRELYAMYAEEMASVGLPSKIHETYPDLWEPQRHRGAWTLSIDPNTAMILLASLSGAFGTLWQGVAAAVSTTLISWIAHRLWISRRDAIVDIAAVIGRPENQLVETINGTAVNAKSLHPKPIHSVRTYKQAA